MSDFSYILDQTGSTPGGDAGFAQGNGPANAFTDAVGYGILTPFRRGPNDIVAGGGVALIQSMISQVLGTAASSDYTEGEIPWRPEFGSLLHFLRHRPNNATTAELARVYVADALARWIPQIRLKTVNLDRKEGPNGELSILLIRLKYDIIGVNRPGNMVLVPDLSQSVTLMAA